MATLLLTRPEAASHRFAKQVADLGLECVISPVMEIVPTQTPMPRGAFSGLIVTSAHGAALIPDMDGIPAYVVGARTARLVREKGAKLCLEANDARDLLARLPAEVVQPLLFVRGTHVAANVADELEKRGITCTEWVAYDQRAKPLNSRAKIALREAKTVLLPVFSPRSAALLVSEVIRLKPTSKIVCVAMSEAVAKVLRERQGAEVFVAQEPNGAAMAQCIAQVVNRRCLLEGE